MVHNHNHPMGERYEYLGKGLNLCSPRRLIDCILSLKREITYLRKNRDEYLDRAIRAELRLEALHRAMASECAREYVAKYGEAA